MDIGIILGVLGILIAISSYFIPWPKLKELFVEVDLQKFFENHNFRANYKIAIIDDDIECFPVDFFRDMGFDVHCFESISFADSLKITKFDVVFLDVKGVVMSLLINLLMNLRLGKF